MANCKRKEECYVLQLACFVRWKKNEVYSENSHDVEVILAHCVLLSFGSEESIHNKNARMRSILLLFKNCTMIVCTKP